MHFLFYRKSAKGSEEVEKAMDQLQAQIREEAYGKRLNLAKDKKKEKEKKTFLELAKGFWRVKMEKATWVFVYIKYGKF